ncbi:MAG: flavin reductase family protein [Candidatus Binatia bacterium]
MALIEELKEVTTGIYVLTVRDGEVRHGMSSSWVTQVSGEPPLLLAAVDTGHFSHAVIRRTGRFGLNVVGRGARALEDHFYSPAAREADNLARFATEDGPGGVPLLLDAMVSFGCRVEAEHTAGDHALFVAAVEAVRRRGADVPLTSLDLEYVYLGTGRIVRR